MTLAHEHAAVVGRRTWLAELGGGGDKGAFVYLPGWVSLDVLL